MKVSLNGTAHELEAETLADALNVLGYGEAVIATALNGRFVPVAARACTPLTDGDEIEVVAPMQGG
jgi:sulfur carrier protein